jgi:uncharacterized protein (DUF2252 family)
MRTVAFALLLAAAGCSGAVPARESEIASTYARADLTLLRTRPELVAGKYARMQSAIFEYYRGSMPVALHDFRQVAGPLSRTSFPLAQPLVYGIGDPHPENFGILQASDGSLALEPNDFDGADRVPYLWDLRRLAVGMVIAAEAANADDPTQHETTVDQERAIARSVAVGYATAMQELADGSAGQRIDAPGTSTILQDLFKRANRDLAARAELAEMTVVTGGQRRLIRGVLDPTDPQNVLGNLPPFAVAALPATLATYRASLIDPPPPAYFTVLDAVREFGSGVASWPLVRVLILVQGPTRDPDDDVVLELKELADSHVADWWPPGVEFDTVQERVKDVSRAVWARPDAEPLWGVSSWLGFPVQVKREAEGQKTIRTKRFVEDRGTPQALSQLGNILGGLLARIHATPTPDNATPARDVWAVIARDPTGFEDEQTDAALSYAHRVESDFTLFNRALTDFGPLLGVRPQPSDAPPADLAAVYGNPPPP